MICDPDEPPVGRAARSERLERRQSTRTALLDSAERLWAERGIRGASLDEIAGGAGMTKGAVYSNFAGKTDLLLALLDRYTQDDRGCQVSEIVRDTGLPPRERFAEAGRRYARRFEADEMRLRAMLLMELWLYGMRDFAAGWRIADWYHDRREHIAGPLTATPGLSPQDHASLALAIDFGLAIQHLLDPDRVPAELYASGIRMVLGPALP